VKRFKYKYNFKNDTIYQAEGTHCEGCYFSNRYHNCTMSDKFVFEHIQEINRCTNFIWKKDKRKEKLERILDEEN